MRLRLAHMIAPVMAGIFFLWMTVSVYAGQFSVRPNGGYVNYGDDFYIDVLIDSEGDDISLARAVILFDPSLVKVKEVSVNNGIFQSFQEDKQIVDNTNGVLQIEGFSQSGTGRLYKTAGEPDVLARIRFETVYPDVLKLEWKYSGQNMPNDTVMMADASPPRNVLTSKPSDTTFTIQAPQSASPGGGNHPATGEVDPVLIKVAVVIGMASMATGAVYIWSHWLQNDAGGRRKTVVVLGEQDND